MTGPRPGHVPDEEIRLQLAWKTVHPLGRRTTGPIAPPS
jgi:hypothetical protein